MSAVPKTLLTPQEYLARERCAETKSQYYRGEVFDMSGASFEHTTIKDNLARETGNQLKDSPCRALTSDMRVKVSATGLYTYPDIVVCDEPQFEDAYVDTLLNPRVIVEVLSESTEKYDRGDKFHSYRQIPSLKEFVLISQTRSLIERYVRQGDEKWLLTFFNDLSQVFDFTSISVRVPLSEIYRGVQFPGNAGT
jgi:Uma2 family endonuclease